MKPELRLYRHLPRYDSQRESAVTIGNFDGVHRGHQAILARLRQAADVRGLASTVITFTPHPRAYFAQRGHRPELIPTQINSLRDKIDALTTHGVEQVVLKRFNQSMADMSAEDFILSLLVRGLNTRWILVGEDFRFGRQRRGNLDLLAHAGRDHGFHVDVIADVADTQGHRISSSEVRNALAGGHVERANFLLGRPYQISGHVIHGKKLGRDIGFPTLNLRVPQHCAARSGIYVVLAHGLAPEPMRAVASIGVRPTVAQDGELLLEVHLLDASVDAYGKLVRIEFLEHLRDEAAFPGLDALVAAIEQDVQRARLYFATHGR
ncbi:MAG: bifunctional riboflavin kinase/FAD synthetase [Candidimonas sp.]